MHERAAFTVFATAIGDCALAWNEVGVLAAWLPEASATRLRMRLAKRFAQATEARPEGLSAAAVAAITALLDGERTDLGFIRIDDSRIDPFDRRVYATARTIPVGRVVSYAELAARVGEDASAREVGQSLGRNPFPIIVPCHRVLPTGGALGHYSAGDGPATKAWLLQHEHAEGWLL